MLYQIYLISLNVFNAITDSLIVFSKFNKLCINFYVNKDFASKLSRYLKDVLPVQIFFAMLVLQFFNTNFKVYVFNVENKDNYVRQ